MERIQTKEECLEAVNAVRRFISEKLQRELHCDDNRKWWSAACAADNLFELLREAGVVYWQNLAQVPAPIERDEATKADPEA